MEKDVRGGRGRTDEEIEAYPEITFLHLSVSDAHGRCPLGDTHTDSHHSPIPT